MSWGIATATPLPATHIPASHSPKGSASYHHHPPNPIPMRLQTLEIKGFKSFADKTVIHFNEDVIGVVGPNGCGKSNIVDAIRWVLGEQRSKELRSDKMESVIFNGTKSRKPSGVAEVSLTFENNKGILPTEYATVKITRILYRSGESEYQLNGTECRLKDIANLLIDTGIGSNSYAIIALGMVDDLLADRENSRRRLFEQAAGITKFKTRKQETLTKLRGTEEDLARVEDLLFELEGQLKTLEKQAKRAQRYNEMRTEYRTLSIELAVWRLSRIKAQFEGIKQRIDTEQDTLTRLDAQIATLEATLARAKQQNLDEEMRVSERQRGFNALVGKLKGLENDKKVAEQKIVLQKGLNRALIKNGISKPVSGMYQVVIITPGFSETTRLVIQ